MENYFSKDSCVHKGVCFYEKKINDKLGITKIEFYGKCVVCNKKLDDREIWRVLLKEFPYAIARYKQQAFLSKNLYHKTIYQLEKERQEIIFIAE